MTTVTQIINDAFREVNLIAIGGSPSAGETDEALRFLNRFVRSLFGNEMGELLEPMALGKGNINTQDNVPQYMDDLQDFYVPNNVRLMCNLTGSMTLNLNPAPYDGSRFGIVDVSDNLSTYPLTFNGNGRSVEGNTSVTLNTNGIQQEWFYRDDLGDWVKLSELTASDNSPFPEEFDDFLSIGLAMRLMPRAGATMPAETASTFNDIRRKFYDRYTQRGEVPTEQALVRLPSNRLYRPSYGFSNYTFARGIPIW